MQIHSTNTCCQYACGSDIPNSVTKLLKNGTYNSMHCVIDFQIICRLSTYQDHFLHAMYATYISPYIILISCCQFYIQELSCTKEHALTTGTSYDPVHILSIMDYYYYYQETYRYCSPHLPKASPQANAAPSKGI